jgi:hypothetical protein
MPLKPETTGVADRGSRRTERGGDRHARPRSSAGAAAGARTRVGTGATGSVAQLDATSGDFNRDGFADVALNYRDTRGTGRVVWFAGSAGGPTRAGILAVRGGRSVAAGDFTGNGYDDLVIGQPYASESGGRTGGQITMVPGTAAGLAGSGTKVIHQDGVGVASTDRPGDAFGASVSAGDYNADRYADALVGAPGEDLTSDGVERTDAGQATLFQGSASGLTTSGTFTLNQDTPGILTPSRRTTTSAPPSPSPTCPDRVAQGSSSEPKVKTQVTASFSTRPSPAPASVLRRPSRSAAPHWAHPPAPVSVRHWRRNGRRQPP